MIKVTGVRFRQAGKVYYFDPKNLKLERGSHVIVETARGIEYGTVIVPPKGITDDEVVQPLKAVIRVATPEDDRIEERNHEKEKEAYKICLEKCTLMSKPSRRVVDVPVDYIGYEIPDEFVVGYGLDYAQRYRNLPYVGVVEFE